MKKFISFLLLLSLLIPAPFSVYAGIQQQGSPGNNLVTGSLTAGHTIAINTNGMSSVLVNVSGSWSGTINTEETIDGTTWFFCTVVNLATLQDTATTFIAANGPYVFNVAGATQFRLNGGNITGTATVQMAASTDSSVSNMTLGIGLVNSTDSSDGPVAPGTVANNSILGGVQYNSTLPTLGNTQQSAVQGDSRGRLLIGSLTSGTSTIGSINIASGGSAVTASLAPGTSTLVYPSGGATFPVSGTFWQATQPISGSVSLISGGSVSLLTGTSTIGSVNQGTNPWIVQDLASGSSIAQAPTKTMLVGGTYNPIPVTLTGNSLGTLQLDPNQNLLIKVNSYASGASTLVYPSGGVNFPVSQTGSPWGVSLTGTSTINVTQFGSNNVVTGTGASGTGIPRVTVSNDSVVGLAGGNNNIGSVNIASGGSTINVSQFGSNNIVTGTGAGGSGIPRVTVSNDSNILATQSAGFSFINSGNNAWTVTPGNSVGKTNVIQTGNFTTASTAYKQILSYTVTSGKTLYVDFMELAGKSTSVVSTETPIGTCSFQNPNGSSVLTFGFNAGAFATDRMIIPFNEPLHISSGTDIVFSCLPNNTGSTYWEANFRGYEK